MDYHYYSDRMFVRINQSSDDWCLQQSSLRVSCLTYFVRNKYDLAILVLKTIPTVIRLETS